MWIIHLNYTCDKIYIQNIWGTQRNNTNLVQKTWIDTSQIRQPNDQEIFKKNAQRCKLLGELKLIL